MTTVTQPHKDSQPRLIFHAGQALKAVADTYPSLVKTILEIVQNGLDADATNISVHIDRSRRHVIVEDNGRGVTPEQFNTALQNVCQSQKDDSRLGRFGRGLISPLGKCEEFVFISSDRESGGAYVEWLFNTEQITASHDYPVIPMRSRPEIRHGKHGVTWRTRVHLKKFTKDRVISRLTLDELEQSLLERYRAVMLKNDVTVELTIAQKPSDGGSQTRIIRARPYDGQPLETWTYEEKDSGITSFRLYRARKTGKAKENGKVSIFPQGNPFRLEFPAFAKAAKEWLEPDAVKLLSSGMFEGEIESGRGVLHPDRDHFVQNDALVGLCMAINAWYEEVGSQYRQSEQEMKKTERFQQLGIAALQRLEVLLGNQPESPLWAAIRGFQTGTVGDHHAPTRKPKLGLEDLATLATTGGATTPRPSPKPKEGPTDVDRKPPKENPDHNPFTVSGPKGSVRTRVRDNSLGLTIVHEEMVGSSRSWAMDKANGVLRLNTLHPNWQRVEGDDRALVRYQLYAAVQALTLCGLPPRQQEMCEDPFEDFLANLSPALVE